MILIDKTYKFGIIWEVLEVSDSFCFGGLNFIIDSQLTPQSYQFNYTLGTVFSNLQHSFISKDYSEGSCGELGNRKINFNKLEMGEEPDIFPIETTELGDKFGEKCTFGCTNLWLGYTSKEERLIYSTDFNITFKEIRLPRNTVENIIMKLPTKAEEFKQEYESRQKLFFNHEKLS